jgi:hypothetical protein
MAGGQTELQNFVARRADRIELQFSKISKLLVGWLKKQNLVK